MTSKLHDIKKFNTDLWKQTCLKNLSELSKKAFLYAYDYDKTYGVKYKNIGLVSAEPNEEMFTILDKLATRELSGHAAREAVEKHACIHGDLIKLICNKDLDVGVSVKTFNKVYPGYIPEFNVQLAQEQDIKKLKFPLAAQLKYDGVRVITLIKNGVVTFRTRNGKTFEFPELFEELQNFPDNTMIDGELVLETGRMEDRTKISGIVNSAIQGTPIRAEGVKYYLFDAMPVKDFIYSKCDMKYSHRMEYLMQKMQYVAGSDIIKLAASRKVHNAYEATKYFEAVLALGYEGLILKSPDHYYTFKRTKDWVKMKAIKDCTLTVQGIEAGQDKYEGMIGALQCTGIVEGKEVSVNIGSGLSDTDRKPKYIDVFIGSKVDVKYNAVIQDSKTGKYSLFIPRYVSIRCDI